VTWTIGSILNQTALPRLEAELLLAHALGLKRIELFINYERVLQENELAKFKTLIQRRSQHEPIAYITGNQPFMSLEFFVDRSVLIPRPETEELVEKVIDLALAKDRKDPVTIADIGTGCGCIAVSLAKFLPQARVFGTDSSAEAIKIAKQNAEKHQVADRCQFIIGNMFDALFATKALRHEGAQKFDIIVSNPPYIPTKDIEGLAEDVKIWEPKGALDGGKDGLDYIRKLIEEAPNHLSTHSSFALRASEDKPPKGLLLIEIGIDQADKIKELSKNKFRMSAIKKDRQGKERFFFGQK
jgi:release factor glutamine methyltransferase